MAYAAAMMTTLFIAFAAIVYFVASYFKERSQTQFNMRRSWIREHWNEIFAAMQSKSITVRIHDSYGIPKIPTDTTNGYSFISDAGQQTRVLSIDETYNLLRKAENVKDLNKLIFGKYLYRQYNVK